MNTTIKQLHTGEGTTEMAKDKAEAINKVEVTLTEAGAEHNAMVTTDPDPAPPPQAMTMRRLDELLAQVSDHAVSQLRELRDDVDATIRAIQDRQDNVRLHFQDHVDNIVEAVQFRVIAAKHLSKVRERFAKGI